MEEDTRERYVPLRLRKRRIGDYEGDPRGKKPVMRSGKGERQDIEDGSSNQTGSLLDTHLDLVKEKGEIGIDQTDEDQKKEEEQAMLDAFKGFKPLKPAAELARNIEYKNSMKSTWRPPSYLEEADKASPSYGDIVRKVLGMVVSGEEIVPPILDFRELRLPKPFLTVLKRNNIKVPSFIQIQGLPVALSGRDMIGIAFTGTGKTLVFVLPMIVKALELGVKLRLAAGEGPFALCVVPSRELATQIEEVVREFLDELVVQGFPELKCIKIIGGESIGGQARALERGIHLAIGTPGRIIDMLEKKILQLRQCQIFALDEADRLADGSFEEEIRNILTFFRSQRQTLLFSATMPMKIQQFVKSALVNPIIVNVGRAGAANLDIIQEIEFVLPEKKIVYLLQCLLKTAPPVLVFAENRSDVDDIHEYLLIKGISAVAIHGGKSQEERSEAVKLFKRGKKDVLIATDVASKGLDFPCVNHVINFDMSKEIENYVHRIGRTGRNDRTGVATTFVNRLCSNQVLADLKQLLLEAKQVVPPFLEGIVVEEAARDIGGVVGCAYCGGLGHRVTECPKLSERVVESARAIQRNAREAEGI